MYRTPFKDARNRRFWMITLPLVCALLLGAFSLLLSPTGFHNTTHAAGATVTPVSDPFALITSPTPSTALFVNQPVTITAQANGGSLGPITQVNFKVDGTQIGSSTLSPYFVTWIPSASGTHTIVAAIVVNGGGGFNSPGVTVTVQPAPPGPTVSFITPTNGTTFTNLDSILLTTNATPQAGTTVPSVTYTFVVEGSNSGIQPIGTSTFPFASYQLIWNPTTITGTILLSAQATDNLGRSGPLATITIQINMAPTPTPTPATGFCMAHYQLNNQWTPGFSAAITITNTGTTAINGWVLQFTFPCDQQITQIWNGSFKQSGETVTISNLSYNANIPPAGSINLGFNGTWTHNDSSPTSFTLNGTVCTTG